VLLNALCELKSSGKITPDQKAAVLLPKSCINLGRWFKRQAEILQVDDCVKICLAEGGRLSLEQYRYVFVDQFEDLPENHKKDLQTWMNQNPKPSTPLKVVILLNTEEAGYRLQPLLADIKEWPTTFTLDHRLRCSNLQANFLNKVCPRMHILKRGPIVLNKCHFARPRASDALTAPPTDIHHVQVKAAAGSETAQEKLAEAIAKTVEYAHEKKSLDNEDVCIVVDTQKCPVTALQEALFDACKISPVIRDKVDIPRAPIIVQAPLLAPVSGTPSSTIPLDWWEDIGNKLKAFQDAAEHPEDLNQKLGDLRKFLTDEREKLENYSSVWQKPVALLEYFLNQSAKKIASYAPLSPTRDEVSDALKPLVTLCEKKLPPPQYNFVSVLETDSVGGYEAPAVISVWNDNVHQAAPTPLNRARTKLVIDTRAISRATMFSFVMITPEYEKATVLQTLDSVGAQLLDLV
jgi:hypothetical protein